MKRNSKRAVLSIAAISIFLLAAWFYFRYSDYSVSVTIKDDGSVILHSLFLGEYYTPVTLFEVYESNTNNSVVKLKANTENSRIHSVTIREGVNQFRDMYLDGYIVEYKNNSPYYFKARKEYTAKFWYGDVTKEVIFVIPENS